MKGTPFEIDINKEMSGLGSNGFYKKGAPQFIKVDLLMICDLTFGEKDLVK